MLTEPARRHSEPVDALGGMQMLETSVAIRQAEQDAAWAYIRRHCEDADEIGRILGVIV